MSRRPVAVSNAVLAAELEQVLSSTLGRETVCITDLRRKPLIYSSSTPIEELEVSISGCLSLSLIFKDLSPSSLLYQARLARPPFLRDPQREIYVYRSVLPGLDAGTPRYYGDVSDEISGRYWLFVEPVNGVRLEQIGDFAVWEEAAAWLARLHSKGTRLLAKMDPVGKEKLIRHNRSYYRRWLNRAKKASEVRQGRDMGSWGLILSEYERSISELVSLPATLLHGEFYPSNILVRDGVREQICPVDWEMASVGPALVDIAALISGHWTESERRRLVESYRSAACIPGLDLPRSFDSTLLICRLHVAVQWLGWSLRWRPPPWHARNWLAEATGLAESIAGG